MDGLLSLTHGNGRASVGSCITHELRAVQAMQDEKGHGVCVCVCVSMALLCQG